MPSKILKTPVDDLVELVRNNNHCSIDFIINKMKLPAEVIEKWLVILEEYKVITVKYKGFEGFVSISQKEMESKKKSSSNVDVDNLRDIFIQKSKDKNMSYDKMKSLWPVFIAEYEQDIKQLFEDKAKASGFEPDKIEMAWLRYKKELETL